MLHYSYREKKGNFKKLIRQRFESQISVCLPLEGEKETLPRGAGTAALLARYHLVALFPAGNCRAVELRSGAGELLIAGDTFQEETQDGSQSPGLAGVPLPLEDNAPCKSFV